MKALSKLLADFIAWRWSPAVGLLSASLLYVLVVVGLIPTEIGVPVANSKFAPKSLSNASLGDATASPLPVSTSDVEASAASPSPRTLARAPGAGEFGRRGFSPPLERPDPPPAPAPPPVIPPPVAVAVPAPVEPQVEAPAAPPAPGPPPGLGAPVGGRMSGLFQGISGAMRARGYVPSTQAPAPPAPDGQAPPAQAPAEAPAAPDAKVAPPTQ